MEMLQVGAEMLVGMALGVVLAGLSFWVGVYRIATEMYQVWIKGDLAANHWDEYFPKPFGQNVAIAAGFQVALVIWFLVYVYLGLSLIQWLAAL